MRQRLVDRSALRERQTIISTGFDGLCRNLWAAIVAIVDSYGNCAPDETAEHSEFGPDNCWARAGQQSRESRSLMTGDPRKLELRFDSKKATVGVSYQRCPGSKSQSFSVGVNGDGQATFLGADGVPISVEDLARLIVDPFLFPGLPAWSLEAKQG